MMQRWRPLVLAAAFEITGAAGMAAAQTLFVRSAPPGSTVEFVLNSTTLGSATVDSAGEAMISANQSPTAAKIDMDAYIHVDTCDKITRVLLLERGFPPPPPEAGCVRNQVFGLFEIRNISTLVVSVAGPNPTVLLRQGRFKPRPLNAPPRVWGSSRTGLALFGGGGLAKFSDASALACGDLSECSGGGFERAFTAGAAVWLSRFLAVEGSYLRPAKVNVEGSGTGFRFTGFLDAEIVTASGKVGVPVGPVKLYGQGGANYHWASSGTTQTIDDTTVTIDGVTQTIKGGTQTYGLRTRGWGWQFGGGLEAWMTNALALYGEFGRVIVKGSARDGAEGSMDDGLTVILIGARVRIGR